MQGLDPLATAAQLKLVFAVHSLNADKALFGAESTTHAGELVSGIGHHRSHHGFKVVAGALELRRTHQLKLPGREDADGVTILSSG